jgi:hypothetical protein
LLEDILITVDTHYTVSQNASDHKNNLD